LIHVRQRHAVLIFGATVGCALVAGCGQSATSSQGTTTRTTPARTQQAPSRQLVPASSGKQTAAGQCIGVPSSLRLRILAHTILKGARFTRVAAVAAPAQGYYYITSEVHGGGAPPHSLATWVTKALDGKGPVYSVDAFAALISTYGASTGKSPYLAIGAPEAYRSRKCVEPAASRGEAAPASGSSKAAAG
jgi:hypothetical protein